MPSGVVLRVGCRVRNSSAAPAAQQAPALTGKDDRQMTDAISTSNRRLRERGDALWSLLQTTSLQIPLRKDARHTSPTWAEFSERFDRCFRAVCDHVNGRVIDNAVLRHIVTRVLTENMDLFIAQHDDPDELERVRASADRLLGLGAAATIPGAGTFSDAREHSVGVVRSGERE
jgi:hypothetical protein